MRRVFREQLGHGQERVDSNNSSTSRWSIHGRSRPSSTLSSSTGGTTANDRIVSRFGRLMPTNRPASGSDNLVSGANTASPGSSQPARGSSLSPGTGGGDPTPSSSYFSGSVNTPGESNVQCRIECVSGFEVMEAEPSETEQTRYESSIKGRLLIDIKEVVQGKRKSWRGGYVQLYKDGSQNANGRTTICIVCTDESLAEILQKGLIERQTLKDSDFPCIIVADPNLRFTGGDILRSPYIGCNFFLRLPESVAAGEGRLSYGQPLEIPGPHGISSRCTLGGLVILDGQLYGLTIGHLFDAWDEDQNEDSSDNVSQSSTEGRRSQTESRGNANFSTKSRKGLKFSKAGAEARDLSPGGDESRPGRGSELSTDFPYWLHLGKLHDFAAANSSDWALVAIDRGKDLSGTPLLDYPNQWQTLETCSISDLDSQQDRNSTLCVEVKSGYSPSQLGTIRVRPTFWWFGKKEFDVYEVVMDRPLVPGDSGSWVIYNGKLCGIVVGALDSLRTAFVLSIQNVFHSITSQTDCSNIGAILLDNQTNFTLPNLEKISQQQLESSIHELNKPRKLEPAPALTANDEGDKTYERKADDVSTLSDMESKKPLADKKMTNQLQRERWVDENVRLEYASESRASVTSDNGSLYNNPMSRLPSELGGFSQRAASPIQQQDPEWYEIRSIVSGTKRAATLNEEGKISRQNPSATYDSALLISLGSWILRMQKKMRDNAFASYGKRPALKLVRLVRYYIERQRFQASLGDLFGTCNGGKICPSCADLDLDTTDFVETRKRQVPRKHRSLHFVGGSGSGHQEHGTLLQITVRSLFCSLCKLILDSLKEQDAYKWTDPSNVLLSHPNDQRSDWVTPSPTQSNHLDDLQWADLHELCYLSWRVDGQKISADQHKSVIGPRFLKTPNRQTCTRRIQIDWALSIPTEPAHLVLSASSAEAERLSPDFLAKMIDPRISSVSVVQSWLKNCEVDHGDVCNKISPQELSNLTRKPFFTVVDLRDWKLSQLPERGIYVALSYTWGGKAGFLTMKNNIRKLQDTGGVQQILNQLPGTIRDAIFLSKRLGIRYFWVDALCIVHDSKLSWDMNARIIDQVFSLAEFTIIAMTRDKVSAISPANHRHKYSTIRNQFDNEEMDMSLSLRRPQPFAADYSQSIRLMALYPYQYYVERSSWNQRAWTFQEGLMSRRCVIFVEDRIFFQCRSAIGREDIVSCHADSWSLEEADSPIRLLQSIVDNPLQVYLTCVQIYSQRKLSFKPDVLHAFSGVGNHVGRLLGNQGLLYGLPRSHFDLCLLWQLIHPGEFRDSPFGPKEFPSWSWSGWAEAPSLYDDQMLIEISVDVSDWFKNHTWIIWYARDKIGNLRLVWNPKREPSGETKASHLAAKWRGYRLPEKERAGKADVYGRAEPGSWSEHPTEFFETLPEFPSQAIVEEDETEKNPPIEDPFSLPIKKDLPLLQFWTFSAYFELGRLNWGQRAGGDDSRQARKSYWTIIDCNNEIRGFIRPEIDTWTQNEDDRDIDISRGSHRFIALSEARYFTPNEMKIVPRPQESDEWNLFYVLLVAEISGISYRMGLGKVQKDAFNSSCRNNGNAEWSEIILG